MERGREGRGGKKRGAGGSRADGGEGTAARARTVAQGLNECSQWLLLQLSASNTAEWASGCG